MVTSLMNQQAAREAGYEMVQYIATSYAALASGAVVKKSIGTVPKGAVITGISSGIAVALTGGTPALTLGRSATPTDLVAAMAEAAGTELLVPAAAFSGPLAADTEFFVNLGGGITAGNGSVAIMFVKPLA